MAAYWLTFRIHDETTAKGTYDERYDALVAAIKKNATLWWGETTSFMAFQSAGSLEALTAAFKRAIDPDKDLFLMRKMDTKDAIICGRSDDADIYRLMVGETGSTYLKKL